MSSALSRLTVGTMGAAGPYGLGLLQGSPCPRSSCGHQGSPSPRHWAPPMGHPQDQVEEPELMAQFLHKPAHLALHRPVYRELHESELRLFRTIPKYYGSLQFTTSQYPNIPIHHMYPCIFYRLNLSKPHKNMNFSLLLIKIQ